MTEPTPSATEIAPATCAFPGCDEPVERVTGPGRPKKFCARPDHNAQTKFRAKAGGSAPEEDHDGADMGRPVSMAKTRAEITREKIAQQVEELHVSLRALAAAEALATDSDAVDAQIEAVTTEAQQRISVAEAALAAERTRRLGAEDAAREALEAAEEMAVQVDEIQARCQDIEAERDQAREQVNDLSTQLTQHQGRIGELSAELERTTGQLNAVQAELTEAAAQRDRAQADNTQLTQQLESARRDIETQTGRADRAETRASEQEQARAAAEQASREAELRAQAAESEAHRSADALATAGQRLSEREEQLTEIRTELTERDKQIRTLTADRDAERSEKVAAERRADREELARTAAEKQIADATAERDRALAAAERATGQVTTLLGQLAGGEGESSDRSKPRGKTTGAGS